ncbi:MAG: hypothetical protein JO309_09940 [Pseudonocardiales bacterium]|nr:hypothetical protein [Pseudonocardiales bacterium]MBV9729705.1 hypothetical protein [Pseudonocardiales bacterium]
MAGAGTLDDVDVGVADLFFDLGAELGEVVSGLGEQVEHAQAAQGGRGPQRDLRGAVFDDEGLHVAGSHPQPAGEVDAEAQAVDERAGGEHPIMAGLGSGEVGQRIGRAAAALAGRRGRSRRRSSRSPRR